MQASAAGGGPPPRPENREQSRLLARLRDGGPASRVELGELLELPRARVAVELTRLTELGLVQVGGPAASRGGRRSTLVTLAPDLRLVGVDVGATSVRLGVTDGRAALLAERQRDCPVRNGPVEVLRLVRELAAEVLAAHPGRLLAAGIGLPGPVSFAEGMAVAPPIMPGWDRYPVRDQLAGALGCPVAVDNDVNVMALGERFAGVAGASDDVVFVKVGTGIGCGVVLGGRIHRGAQGSAGDIGHIRLDDYGPVCACGQVGCLEAYFGGAALARDAAILARSGRSATLAAALERDGALSARHVGAAVAAGDPAAVELVREGGHRLGQVIASLVSFLNPGMIVIGGGVSHLGHLLLAEVRSVVYRRSLPLATGNLPVVLSELGDEAGMIGAAYLGSERGFTSLAR